jgi:hypothetical protein
MEFPARRSGTRALVVTLAIGLICALIFPATYWEEDLRGRWDWQKYEREARTRGVKLDLAELIPPSVPDSENFARIPIFDAAFRASDRGQTPPNPFKLPARSTGELPHLDDPFKQTRIDLADWAKYFVEIHLLPAAGDDPAADVLQALEHFSVPLAQIHEAARRPHCRFPIHWEKGFAPPLPHLPVLQSAVVLDALRLSAHLAWHDSPAALDDFRNGMKLITLPAREPSLIGALFRSVDYGGVLIRALWGGLSEHRWDASELAQIETDLFQLDWLQEYAFAVGAERGACNGIHDVVINDPHRLNIFSGENAESTKRFIGLYPVGWFYQSKARTNRFFDESLARVDVQAHRLYAERPVPSDATSSAPLTEKLRFMLFFLFTPALRELEKKFVQLASITAEARLACALERSRLAHGHYPEKLAELAPEFIPSVPAEVVNGEPYRYRRTDDDNFVLYSVGTDLRDDGGTIDPKLSASKQRDWVWRYPE